MREVWGEEDEHVDGAESFYLLTMNAAVHVILEFIIDILHWSNARPEVTLCASSVGTKSVFLPPPPVNGSFLSSATSFCNQSVMTCQTFWVLLSKIDRFVPLNFRLAFQSMN